MATTDNMAKEMAIELMRLMIADKTRDEIEAEIFRIFPTATPEDRCFGTRLQIGV